MNKSIAFTKNFSLPAISATISMAEVPLELKAVTFILIAAYGFFTDVFPDESDDFMKRLEKAIPDIKNTLINSKELQQSLVDTYESLARTSIKEKREVIKSIYLNEYLPASKRENIELARYYRIIKEISIESLQHLKLISDSIIPMKVVMIRKQVDEMAIDHSPIEDEWWYKLEYYRKPDSQVIQEWIYQEYNANSSNVKKTAPREKTMAWTKWHKEITNRNRVIEEKFAEYSAELISLGIFRMRGDGTHTLTEFGSKLIKLIPSFVHANE